MSDRIESIKKLLAAEPSDAFLQYSLAMEYVAAEQPDEALAAFEQCRLVDPTYVPAYVEAGKCARAAGRLDQAKAMFVRALELAQSAGDTHIAANVRQQLEALA